VSLFHHWQRALFGFGCLLVAFWFFIVMTDILASYKRRKESPNQRVRVEAGCRMLFTSGCQWPGAGESE
jgi:hypothetical protein